MAIKLAILASFALGLSAAYQNLIAIEDGSKVYFTAPVSITGFNTFLSDGHTTLINSTNVDDMDGAGHIFASSHYAARLCGTCRKQLLYFAAVHRRFLR